MLTFEEMVAESLHDVQIHVSGGGVLSLGVLALDDQIPVQEVGQHAVAAGARDQEGRQVKAGRRRFGLISAGSYRSSVRSTTMVFCFYSRPMQV